MKDFPNESILKEAAIKFGQSIDYLDSDGKETGKLQRDQELQQNDMIWLRGLFPEKTNEPRDN